MVSGPKNFGNHCVKRKLTLWNRTSGGFSSPGLRFCASLVHAVAKQ